MKSQSAPLLAALGNDCNLFRKKTWKCSPAVQLFSASAKPLCCGISSNTPKSNISIQVGRKFTGLESFIAN